MKKFNRQENKSNKIMGRMKSLQPTEAGIHNLFSVRYRRLVDENNTNNNQHHNNINNNKAQLVVQNLLRMKLSQDYIAYCCNQCGHHQRFDIKVEYTLHTYTCVLHRISLWELDIPCSLDWTSCVTYLAKKKEKYVVYTALDSRRKKQHLGPPPSFLLDFFFLRLFFVFLYSNVPRERKKMRRR